MFDPDYDIFLDIASGGSISAAARKRGASVPGISKRLARLEQRIGVRLAHRTTRRLSLTDAGKDLADTLLAIRASLSAVEDRMAGRKSGISGPLRLSAPTSFGRTRVLPCLPGFLADYPELDLTVDLSDQYVDMLDGTYDIAVRIGARIGHGLVGHRLATSSRVLCAAPQYLARAGAPSSLHDLAGHHLLAAEGQLPWELDGPEGTVSYTGTSHIRTNSSEVVRELTIGGCGISLRSLWDVAEELERGTLARVLPQYRGSQAVGIFAVHGHASDPPAKISAFIDHLAACLNHGA
ncbi:LysR family transcriptional regulator [Sphingobium sp. HBC34]|uniref:LysR family transcriptional regulator n=1 Tax=Sphingobium cyanobacteriorum TaxID=3063954 RepID=A0ABT8ZIW1_9SPHN|nr:LysR family transcriptional regulator [Sphingobium sp. HBC34]MDO7833486.1 LysR family transcriptional regulator [Sphingobium sp. HBC34]